MPTVKLADCSAELTEWRRAGNAIPSLYFVCPVDPVHVHEIAYSATGGTHDEFGKVYRATGASVATFTVHETLDLPCMIGTITLGKLDYGVR
jgi:hypothetical protein